MVDSQAYGRILNLVALNGTDYFVNRPSDGCIGQRCKNSLFTMNDVFHSDSKKTKSAKDIGTSQEG